MKYICNHIKITLHTLGIHSRQRLTYIVTYLTSYTLRLTHWQNPKAHTQRIKVECLGVRGMWTFKVKPLLLPNYNPLMSIQ